jgi:hypothetical protein
MRQVGGSLGIAIMGALVASEVTATPRDPRYVAQFVNGYHLALHVGAAILIAGAVLAAITIGTARRQADVSVAPQPTAGV